MVAKRIGYALIFIVILAFIGGLPASLVLGEAGNGSQSTSVTVTAVPGIIYAPSGGDGGVAPLPDRTTGPATFKVSRLEISPAEAEIGSTITISILMENTGGEKGTCKVTLNINGKVQQSKYVVLDAGTSTTVTFTTSRDNPGTYSVDINDLVGSFRVEAKPAPTPITPPPEVPPAPTPAPELPPLPPAKEVNWPLVGGITGAVAIGVLAFLLRSRIRFTRR